MGGTGYSTNLLAVRAAPGRLPEGDGRRPRPRRPQARGGGGVAPALAAGWVVDTITRASPYALYYERY